MQVKNTDVVTCFLTARVDQNSFITAFISKPFLSINVLEMRNPDPKI